MAARVAGPTDFEETEATVCLLGWSLHFGLDNLYRVQATIPSECAIGAAAGGSRKQQKASIADYACEEAGIEICELYNYN